MHLRLGMRVRRIRFGWWILRRRIWILLQQRFFLQQRILLREWLWRRLQQLSYKLYENACLLMNRTKAWTWEFRPMLFVLSSVQTPPYTNWPRLSLISPNQNLLSKREVTLILSRISDEINLHWNRILTWVKISVPIDTDARPPFPLQLQQKSTWTHSFKVQMLLFII